MKYIVMLGDGMADLPVECLGGKTPLQVANKPYMDKCAKEGICGLVKTVPTGMPPGSDTANLSVMGYDPEIYYTGRSPIEAVSMGIELAPEDLSFRCNLVTLSDDVNYEDKTMVDYSSEEITTEEAAEIIATLEEHFGNEILQLYAGTSYRHCLVWKNGEAGSILTPPHDISDKKVTDHLPTGTYGKELLAIMKESYEILKDHPVNKKRIERGLNPANSMWLWGEGRKPMLKPFTDIFGVKGSVISAVDLIKGLGICSEMVNIEVPNITGNINTNFVGKGEFALKTLLEDNLDMIYIHVEAPDECGHRGEAENKKLAIELIDRDILGPVMEGLKAAGEDFALLLTPDHATPIVLKTHTSDPIPFAIYRSNSNETNGAAAYDEVNAKSTGYYIDKGCELMGLLINGK